MTNNEKHLTDSIELCISEAERATFPLAMRRSVKDSWSLHSARGGVLGGAP